MVTSERKAWSQFFCGLRGKSEYMRPDPTQSSYNAHKISCAPKEFGWKPPNFAKWSTGSMGPDWKKYMISSRTSAYLVIARKISAHLQLKLVIYISALYTLCYSLVCSVAPRKIFGRIDHCAKTSAQQLRRDLQCNRWIFSSWTWAANCQETVIWLASFFF